MSESHSLTTEEAKSEIALEVARKQNFQELVAEQELWLEKMSRFTSQEEQQHIVGDILEMQRRIKTIDERLQSLQRFIDETIQRH